ncbi:MAG: recombinase RecA [Spirochaetia bacterium]|nr:recombinase RecA [Spirochaetia bacterium]
MSEDKKKALELAISQIEKQFGKGSIMKLGKAPAAKVETITTGALSLDLALGGGIPRGRIIEVFGPESSGKSTLAMSIVAKCQQMGGSAAYVDAENAMDVEYAKNLGIDVDNLLISQPDTGEQALDIVETLVRSGAVDVIVVDSVAALVPKAEIEGEMGDSHMGLQARLMSQAMRKLTAIISKSKTVVIFINQIREKIGVMFGNPETTPGGRALKFYSSVRIDIRRVEAIKKNEAVIGNRVKGKIVKNKVAPPFREAIFEIMFGRGIIRESAMLDVAVDHGVIEKSGTWYIYNGSKIGQGRESVITYLSENPQVTDEIEKKTREKYFAKNAVNHEPEPPEERDIDEVEETEAETAAVAVIKDDGKEAKEIKKAPKKK